LKNLKSESKPEGTLLPSRKKDHIQINLQEDVASLVSTGLEKYHFAHQALPEIKFDDINTQQEVFGKVLKIPLFISSMTGGTPESFILNKTLAEAAQMSGIAMGVGSQRAGLEHPEVAYTYQLRKFAPDILLFANLGAVQLSYGYGMEECKKAVEMIGADALILHLNSLQEALQDYGNTDFSGLINKIETICRQLTVPVIVKEVGWGISETAARMLASAGVAAIDVAGAGGTSWSQVEMYRMPDKRRARIASTFRDWGIPTADSIVQVKLGAPDSMIFASGGLSNGVDLAKTLALGATIGGMAGIFLKAAHESLTSLVDKIHEIEYELRLVMFGVGVKSISDLHKISLIKD
jgi:isopentenyl-diphosphate Delta-isomerase